MRAWSAMMSTARTVGGAKAAGGAARAGSLQQPAATAARKRQAQCTCLPTLAQMQKKIYARQPILPEDCIS